MRAAVVLFLALAACSGEPETTEQAPADTGAPTIYAKASDEVVKAARDDFEACADAVSAIRETDGIGKRYNAAKRARTVCAARVGYITEARAAAMDFRLTDCRIAAISGQELAMVQLGALDMPTAANLAKIETAKAGYEAMAETCRSPDEYLLSQAVRH